MIDLHSHLLPGLDDGPADVAGSVALAAEVAATGVRVMATTPHLRSDFPDVKVLELALRVAELQARLQRERIPLELVSAGEVDVLWAQSASDEQLRAASYGGRGHDLLVVPYSALSVELPELQHVRRRQPQTEPADLDTLGVGSPAESGLGELRRE